MRPAKLSREELLNRCAHTFKRLGYHGTTMDELSNACGLTKASFYHHYPNKDALLKDVLNWTHLQLNEGLFALAQDASRSPLQRFEAIGQKAQRMFMGDAIGCLMGVIAVDASYGKPELMEPIRAFLNDWIAAFTLLFNAQGVAQAEEHAKQLVAAYEGSILMARIYQDPSYIEATTARGIELFKS